MNLHLPTARAGVLEHRQARSGPTYGPLNAPLPFWKRTFDLVCIFLTAPIWLTLMGLVCAWVKLTSPGPLLYRQNRVGLRGRRFVILKFRSMSANAGTEVHERYFEQLMRNGRPMEKLDVVDPRVIRGGRIIRALGLDELPQLFNVIRGEMSLVGPRPCTIDEFARYNSWHRERVKVLPGLTGLWQVNGKNQTTFEQMIRMDLQYASQMSWAGDLMIVLKTIPAIITQVIQNRRKSAPPRLSVQQHPCLH
jgi:lipopolysaccharide/colanic/teichoic acid biosynthesis glycosyltransferase